MLPPNALVILDQFEVYPKNSEVDSMLLNLAVKSREEGFNVIVSISSVEIAHHVLLLNGLDKIYHLGKVEDFRWERDEVELFVNTGFPDLTKEEKSWLIGLGIRSGSPGFLHSVSEFPECVESRKELEDLADRFSERWKNLMKEVRAQKKSRFRDRNCLRSNDQ